MNNLQNKIDEIRHFVNYILYIKEYFNHIYDNVVCNGSIHVTYAGNFYEIDVFLTFNHFTNDEISIKDLDVFRGNFKYKISFNTNEIHFKNIHNNKKLVLNLTDLPKTVEHLHKCLFVYTKRLAHAKMLFELEQSEMQKILKGTYSIILNIK